jgi:hypothetical protein
VERKDQVNHFSIGIELVNFGWGEAVEAGKLRRTQDGGVVHANATRPTSSTTAPPRRASCGPLPRAPARRLLPLIRAIVERHDIDPTQVIGHEHVAPGRKRDPGPRLPVGPRRHRARRPPAQPATGRPRRAEPLRAPRLPAVGGVDGSWGGGTDAAIAGLVARHGAVYGLGPPGKSWAARRAFAEDLRRVPG